MSATPEERKAFVERVLAAPDPLTPTDWWAAEDPYSFAGDAIAKAFYLLLCEGANAEDSYDAYDKLEKRWPGFDNWIGGASGHMVGWGFQAARFMRQEPIPPNPAVIIVSAASPGGGEA